MKKHLIIAALTVLFVATACNKNDDDPVDSSLTATKSDKIKRNEPVQFTLKSVSSTANVQWTVLPSANVQISKLGNSASILFADAGSYTVNAAFGSANEKMRVTVQDSLYDPGSGVGHNELLTGDEVTVSVTKYDSLGIGGLAFLISTSQTYDCLNHTLIFDNTLGDKSLKIDLKYVAIPAPEICEEGKSIAMGATSLYPMVDGTYNFSVILNEVTYEGTIVKSGTQYTINWPYSKGVIVTPIQLK